MRAEAKGEGRSRRWGLKPKVRAEAEGEFNAEPAVKAEAEGER
jgi:hypothetical protein